MTRGPLGSAGLPLLAAWMWAAAVVPARAQPDLERVRTAKTLFFDRKYAQARQAWEAVRAAKGPDAEAAAYWVARCSENLGEHDRALKEYDAFVALGPKDRTLVDEARKERSTYRLILRSLASCKRRKFRRRNFSVTSLLKSKASLS